MRVMYSSTGRIICSNIYIFVEWGNWQDDISLFYPFHLCKCSIFCGFRAVSWCYRKHWYIKHIWWPRPAKYNSDEHILASLSSLFIASILNPSTSHSIVCFQEIQGIIFNHKEHKLSVLLLLLLCWSFFWYSESTASPMDLMYPNLI